MCAGCDAVFGLVGVPTQVVVAAPQTVVIGRNEIDVPPVTLLGGNYWLLMVFDASTAVERTSSGLYGYETWSYASAFQSTWPEPGWNDVANSTYAFFLRIGM